MSEKVTNQEQQKAPERKTLTERRLARLAGIPPTTEQLRAAQTIDMRVREVLDDFNSYHRAKADKTGAQYEPVTTLDADGVWTHNSSGNDEQRAASNGFRVDANSKYEIEVTESGVVLTEKAEEWTKIRGRNGPARSGWLRAREHVLFIDKDGLTQFGEFTTEPTNQPGHDHLGYNERTGEKTIRETGDLRVPLTGYEAEFAERVMSAFEAQYTQQAAA